MRLSVPIFAKTKWTGFRSAFGDLPVGSTVTTVVTLYLSGSRAVSVAMSGGGGGGAGAGVGVALGVGFEEVSVPLFPGSLQPKNEKSAASSVAPANNVKRLLLLDLFTRIETSFINPGTSLFVYGLLVRFRIFDSHRPGSGAFLHRRRC